MTVVVVMAMMTMVAVMMMVVMAVMRPSEGNRTCTHQDETSDNDKSLLKYGTTHDFDPRETKAKVFVVVDPVIDAVHLRKRTLARKRTGILRLFRICSKPRLSASF